MLPDLKCCAALLLHVLSVLSAIMPLVLPQQTCALSAGTDIETVNLLELPMYDFFLDTDHPATCTGNAASIQSCYQRPTVSDSDMYSFKFSFYRQLSESTYTKVSRMYNYSTEGSVVRRLDGDMFICIPPALPSEIISIEVGDILGVCLPPISSRLNVYAEDNSSIGLSAMMASECNRELPSSVSAMELSKIGSTRLLIDIQLTPSSSTSTGPGPGPLTTTSESTTAATTTTTMSSTNPNSNSNTSFFSATLAEPSTRTSTTVTYPTQQSTGDTLPFNETLTTLEEKTSESFNLSTGTQTTTDLETEGDSESHMASIVGGLAAAGGGIVIILLIGVLLFLAFLAKWLKQLHKLSPETQQRTKYEINARPDSSQNDEYIYMSADIVQTSKNDAYGQLQAVEMSGDRVQTSKNDAYGHLQVVHGEHTQGVCTIGDKFQRDHSYCSNVYDSIISTGHGEHRSEQFSEVYEQV